MLKLLMTRSSLSECETVSKCIHSLKETHLVFKFTLRSVLLCLFSVRGKNLAPQGTAHLSRSGSRINATTVIDDNPSRYYKDKSCINVYRSKRDWWRVDFGRLIMIYAVEITPGKIEFLKTGNVSVVNLNKEYR